MQKEAIRRARQDYAAWLIEMGFTEDGVCALSRSVADQLPFPGYVEAVAVGTSQIAGRGLLATRAIAPGECLAPARVQGKRTPAGSTTNHSPDPNAKFVQVGGGDLDLVAVRAIAAGEEVTVSYRQAGQVNGWPRNHRGGAAGA